MSDAGLASWSWWHSAAAAALVPVLVAGALLRLLGPAAVGRDILTAATAASLIGLLVSCLRRSSLARRTALPSSEVAGPSPEERRRLIRRLHRGQPLDPRERSLAKPMAGPQLRSQSTLVWLPILITGQQADGLATRDPHAPLWWVAVVLVLSSALFEIVEQHHGHRWRTAAAWPDDAPS